jgi:type III pantothenate kinase
MGNTQVKLVWFDRGKIIESLRYNNLEQITLSEAIVKRSADKVIISSVGATIPDIAPEFLHRLKKLIVLDHHTPVPVQICYKTPETLGYDRIAAIAGAHYLYPSANILVMDLGTAITVDFINVNGAYLGGNISPGLYTRFRALNEFTVSLPMVEADSTFPRYGTDTRSAIAAGVQQGIIFELEGYIQDFSARYPDCRFIITGGDAGFFVPAFKKHIFACPELVATGLNCILEYNSTVTES